MFRAADRSRRQVAGSTLNILEARKYLNASTYTERIAGGLNKLRILGKEIHTETQQQAIYVHHTTGEAGSENATVTLGLVSFLARLKPGLGLFCPIDMCTRWGNRSQIMKESLKSQGDIAVMKGVTMARAYELITAGKRDDLLEEILQAYMSFRENHDFVVLEGTNLKETEDDALTLNANIAYALNATSLMVANARRAIEVNARHVQSDGSEWKRVLLDNIKLNELAFKCSHAGVMGAIVHQLPHFNNNDSSLRSLLEDQCIAYFGGIPEDCILQSVQVKQIAETLKADVLHGMDLSTEVTKFVFATSNLSDFLLEIQKCKDIHGKIVIVTAANRLDILFGINQLHNSDYCNKVAAIVLTGGRPSELFDFLFKDKSFQNMVPVLLSPLTSFDTATALVKVPTEILSSTPQKIERALTLFNDNIDMNLVRKALLQVQPIRMNAKSFQYDLFLRARQQKQHIVLPEGEEPRTIQAAGALLKKELCHLTLLGDSSKINELACQFQVDLKSANIINPTESPYVDKYADMLYQFRKKKGVTQENAYNLVKDVNYFGTLMVAAGDADGMVSGAIHTTADTIRPALQVIKTEPGLTASSVLFMCLKDKVQVFADCAIHVEPTCNELAAIAVSSADTAMAFGIKPLVAMLSYATRDSNSGPWIQKVLDATTIAKQMRPELDIEGPLQYDAAVNMETAKIKLKGANSAVAGKATVFIFPDLNAGNITYKAVQQSTGAVVMGPIMQGLRKPVNDLSRGCTVDDIVSTVVMTALQASFNKNKEAKP